MSGSVSLSYTSEGGWDSNLWLVEKGGKIMSFDTSELLDRLNSHTELQFQIAVGKLNVDF